MNLVNFWMSYVRTMVQSRIKDERGASLVEYALLVALIAVACIVAINALGGNASTKFTEVGSEIGAA